jgi:hypothetical protein
MKQLHVHLHAQNASACQKMAPVKRTEGSVDVTGHHLDFLVKSVDNASSVLSSPTSQVVDALVMLVNILVWYKIRWC